MDYDSHEPQPPRALARPCSTPHSAPAEWLRAGAQPASSPDEPDPLAHPADDQAQIDAAISLILSTPSAVAELIERAAPDDARSDGWTPFCRRLFLQVLADTGKVTLACEYTGLTRQSAYALAARDPLFAAGWDAAAMLARRPLADDIYEKGVDGVTDTITRNGEVVATRHRYDSRLAIAVLHRLDKRCDRAEERGDQHLALMRHWDEYLGHVGRGEEEAARALIEPAPVQETKHCQTRQLAESANPTEEEEAIELDRHFWREDGDGHWLTDFPPPEGFDGYESGPYGADYERECSEEEIRLLDGIEQLDRDAERAEYAAKRDRYLAGLREELGLARKKATKAAICASGKRRQGAARNLPGDNSLLRVKENSDGRGPREDQHRAE